MDSDPFVTFVVFRGIMIALGVPREEAPMMLAALVLVSLWLIAMLSPRSVSGLIHLLLMGAIVLVASQVVEAREKRARDVRWPPWGMR